ncbi:MAG: hypothetical protein LBL97_03410 [Prevotellaceae bacterium]|jgi:signal transduction histidine kinase|nr:hypothetical protein [Prevotellaceae bacterium]
MNALRRTHFTFFFFLFAGLLLPVSLHGQQQESEQERYKVDSTLYAYYSRCKEHIASPTVITMLDTLFHMAADKGDARMQAVALSTKVDHFYFMLNPIEGTEDSIKKYVNETKEFAQKSNQPLYYYFTWSRLSNFYNKQRKYNLALYEANKMQEETEVSGNTYGMQFCYQALYHIYLSRKLYRQAITYKMKEIETIRDNQLNDYNLSTHYLALAVCYMELNEVEPAGKAMEECRKYINSQTQQASYLCGMLRYYVEADRLEDARRILSEANRFFDEHRQSRERHYLDLLDYSSYYYLKAGEPAKALEYYQRMLSYSSEEEESDHVLVNRRLGAIYTALHDHERANSYYQRAIAQEDSLQSVNADLAVEEFASILNLENLEQENKELVRRNEEITSRNRLYIIILLVAVLILFVLELIRERRLNVGLKRAKASEERANLMKTEFIQNMSHEIRTPLNSIVGFSQILCSEFTDNKETQEYSNIIEQSSNNLLQLINDVLDLSNLDSEAAISTHTAADVSTICEAAVNQVRPKVKAGVKLTFTPEQKILRIQTSPGRVLQVLMHLLQNAAKFTDKGSIDLSWRTARTELGEVVVFRIADTGTGIPPDKRDYVFERFTKLNTFVSGTGLGLPICRMIAEKMGGSLTIDTAYAPGTCMVMTLPLKRSVDLTKGSGKRRASVWFLPLLGLLMPAALCGQEQPEAGAQPVDSALSAYHRYCDENRRSPKVMQMTDTLFSMAAARGNAQIQAAALSIKTEHFYFYHKTEEDSILFYANIAMAFAKRYHVSRAYYSNWSRIVSQYIRTERYNLAIYEIGKMQKEAESTNDPRGLQFCYSSLYRIYADRQLYRQAAECREHEIQIILDNFPDYKNIAGSYYMLALCYVELGEMNKAKEALDKSVKYIGNDNLQFEYYLTTVQYYAENNELPEALNSIKKAEELLKTGEGIIGGEPAIAFYRYIYYTKTGDYKRALEALHVYYGSDEEHYPTEASLELAETYERLKDMPRSMKYYKQYIHLKDSLYKHTENNAINEFATILGKNTLEKENQEILLEKQTVELRMVYLLAVVMGLFVIVTILIIAYQRRLNRLLRKAKKAEENSNHMKTEFIRSMSHEIRTPLNSIVGFSQILSAQYSDNEDTAEMANIIERSTNNLLMLVDDVLELSTLDSLTTIAPDTAVDLEELCRLCIDRASIHAAPGVQMLLVPQGTCYVMTNSQRLTQLLNHILHNATKFTPAGSIRLDYRIKQAKEKKHIELTITDTGIGIPQDKQEFVFERFSKIDTFVPGAGLGLAVCRSIAEKMGGTLTIDPSYTGGCRFVLTIPWIAIPEAN